MLLVNVCHLHGLTTLKGARIGCFKSHDDAEEGCLTCAVRTYDAHDAVRRKHEVEVLEEHLVAEFLADILCFQYLVAETRTVRNEYLKFLLTLLLLLIKHSVVGVKTSLTLCLTSLWSHANPLKLALKSLAALACHLLFHLHALCLLLKP